MGLSVVSTRRRLVVGGKTSKKAIITHNLQMPYYRVPCAGLVCTVPSAGERVIRKSNEGGVTMLFCITANYTPKAMEAMGKNPSTNREESVGKLLTAAGAKLIAMYYTIADGPGAMVIFDADPGVAPAVTGVVASTDAVQNVKLRRLFSENEVRAIRQKRAEL